MSNAPSRVHAHDVTPRVDINGLSGGGARDGARTSRFTFDPAADQFPLWSPDGLRIAFRSLRSGAGDLYQKLASGAGDEERVVASDQRKAPSSWSPDGRFLLYLSVDAQTSADPQSHGDLWVVPMRDDRTPSVLLKTPFRDAYGVFSPDGRWVAYMSNESGRMEIYVRPFVPPSPLALADKPPGASGAVAGTSGGRLLVSTGGGAFPLWRPDGKELSYLSPGGAMMATPITATGSTLEPGAPVVLFPTRIVDSATTRQYDVAPDGRFLINTVLDEPAAPITLLRPWNPGANK